MSHESPNIKYTRPEVKEMFDIWQQVEDCEKGAKAIKKARDKYLPIPNCHDDPQIVKKNYDAYLKRALFYNVVDRTKQGLIGEVFDKDPSLNIPDSFKEFQMNADGMGTSLDQLAQKLVGINLSKGRVGVLCDFPFIDEGVIISKADNVSPRMVIYNPEEIINWRTDFINGSKRLSLLILHETFKHSDDGYEYEERNQYRELRIDESGKVVVRIWQESEKGFEKLGEDYFIQDHLGRYFDFIPFVFIGSQDNDEAIDKPPLYDLSEINIAHYRNSADYEESCFIVGQATPYFSGLTETWVKKFFSGKVILGSKAAIPLPENSSAGMLQANPNSMVYESMQNKVELMKSLGAKLIEPKTGSRTATETVLEASADGSILSKISKNVSNGIVKCLFYCSKFIGDFSEIDFEYEINQSFSINKMNAQERAQLISEWQSGAIATEEMRRKLINSDVAYIEDIEEFESTIDSELIGLNNNAGTQSNNTFTGSV